MSQQVIRALPISTFLAHQGPDTGQQLVARDCDRAAKFLSGVSPHGPRVAHDKQLIAQILARRRESRRGGRGGAADPTAESGTATGGATDSDGTSVDATDAAVTYTLSVGVGSPATNYTLLIDTGSSNTWVGARKKYVQTPTSRRANASVNVSYGSGQFSGTEFTDRVTLATGLVIGDQSIGVASSTRGFDDVDGILGIGPVDLTQGTLSTNELVPTVTDNLFTAGTIPTNSIGIAFEPTTASPSSPDAPGVMNGELTFGGTDDTRFAVTITYTPITRTSPASNYWGIDQSITYGGSGKTSSGGAGGGTQILRQTAGIVDTGTTLLLLATDAFQAYQHATSATLDQRTGLLTLTSAQFKNLESLFFHIGGTTFEFTANAQIWPRALNSTIGGEEGKIYLVVADLGSRSGSGLDFINGFAFLQRFYSVYDTGNSRVGLATTNFTMVTSN